MVKALDRLAVGADVGTSRNVGTQQPRQEGAPQANANSASATKHAQPAGSAISRYHDMPSSDQLLAQLRHKVSSPLGLAPFIPTVGKTPQTEYRNCFSSREACHKSALATEPTPAPELLSAPAKAAAGMMMMTKPTTTPRPETARDVHGSHSVPLRPSYPMIYHGSCTNTLLRHSPRPGTAYTHLQACTVQPHVVTTSKRVAQRPMTASPITHSLITPQPGLAIQHTHAAQQQPPTYAGMQAASHTARSHGSQLQPNTRPSIKNIVPALTMCALHRPGTASSEWSTRVAAAVPTGRPAAQPLLSNTKPLLSSRHVGHGHVGNQAGLSAKQRMELLLAANTCSEQDNAISTELTKPDVDHATSVDEETCSIDIVSWTPAPLSRAMSELGDPVETISTGVPKGAANQHAVRNKPSGRLGSSAADLLHDMQSTLAKSSYQPQASLVRNRQFGKQSKQVANCTAKFAQQAAPMVLCVEDVLQSTPEVLEMEMDRMSLDQLQALRAALDARENSV